MATTYGVHREREPQAPAVPPPDVHLRRRKVMLVLGVLTVSVSYSARLALPGRLCHENGGAHMAGDPLLKLDVMYLWRDKVLFYYNAGTFLASLVVVALLNFPANWRIEWYAQRVAMTLSLLGLIVSNYISEAWLSFMVVLFCMTLQIGPLLCEPVKIELSSVKETPQKCSELLRSKKKKYLLKLERKDHGQQNIVSGRGSGDAYQILKRSQMHLLLLGTLTASVTYQAGLSPWSGFWQGKAADLAGDSVLHDKSYLVFFFCNVSAFVMSLAINPIIILSNVFSTCGTKYYCALQVGVTLELLSLIGAYVAGRRWQDSKFVDWAPLLVVIHVVIFLLQVFLVWAIWWKALREKIECWTPGWLKKLFGLSMDEHNDDDDDDDDDDDEEEQEEEVVIVERKQEKRRKLLLLLAILAAILAYHGRASPRPDKLVSYWHLAFQYCKATGFMASLSIITMLANSKLPEARGVRWHALRVCVILELLGLMGAFPAGGYREISTMDVLVLVLVVLLFTAFHLTMFMSGTARGLVQGLVLRLGSPQLLVGVDPFVEDNGSEDELEFGIAGGTNEEPLGLEISSPILGGSLTLILAVPVMAILANPMKLLVAIMIASIAVSIWRRSFARLLRSLAKALQRRCTVVALQGTTATPPTGSGSSASSSHREQLVSAACQGLCKVIHTLCLGTWMWLLILVISVPSLRPNLKLKFKMSKISGVLGVLVVGAPTMAPATLDTPDTATMDTSTTAAATTVTGTPTTAATAASRTSKSRRDEPLIESRLRRNRRPNSRLIGQDWVN